MMVSSEQSDVLKLTPKAFFPVIGTSLSNETGKRGKENK